VKAPCPKDSNYKRAWKVLQDNLKAMRIARGTPLGRRQVLRKLGKTLSDVYTIAKKPEN